VLVYELIFACIICLLGSEQCVRHVQNNMAEQCKSQTQPEQGKQSLYIH